MERHPIAEQRAQPMPRPPLFEAFPELAMQIPWVSLGSWPTPVERLPELTPAPLWIKRDDLSSPHYGGNKVRKLEFILADVIRRGQRHVVTMGGLGTHHGVATAIYARRLGLSCTVILSTQPVDEHVRANLRLMHEAGAKLVYGGSVARTGLRFFVTERLRRPDAYFLFSGGSTPIGALGFVDAAFELRQQIETRALPAPSHILCALGSGGTLAGLALGVALAGLPSQVVGVRVYPARVGAIAVTTPTAVRSLMQRTLALLRCHCARIPRVELTDPDLIGGYLGHGYGHPTAAGAAASQLLRSAAGIELEPTYTAKTFAALLDFARRPSTPGPLLYWHTYSSADLRAAAAAVDVQTLPKSLHRFFDDSDDTTAAIR